MSQTIEYSQPSMRVAGLLACLWAVSLSPVTVLAGDRDNPPAAPVGPAPSLAEDNRQERDRSDLAVPGFERITIKVPEPVPLPRGDAMPVKPERRMAPPVVPKDALRPPPSAKRVDEIRKAVFSTDRAH